jgi:adenylate cyclase
MLQALAASSSSADDVKTRDAQIPHQNVRRAQQPLYQLLRSTPHDHDHTVSSGTGAARWPGGNGRQYDLKGKAVFVGLSEAVLADRKDSFYTVFSQADGIFIAGVEIAATALSNIIEDTPVKPVGLAVHTLILFLWGMLAGLACRLFSLKIGALNIVGLSVLYLGLAVLLFKNNAIWYPIVTLCFSRRPWPLPAPWASSIHGFSRNSW